MYVIELPYDIGTFVKVKTKDRSIEYYGTVSAYTVGRNEYLIWVSAYKEAMTGEYLPDEVKLMTEKEIEALISDEVQTIIK